MIFIFVLKSQFGLQVSSCHKQKNLPKSRHTTMSLVVVKTKVTPVLLERAFPSLRKSKLGPEQMGRRMVLCKVRPEKEEDENLKNPQI